MILHSVLEENDFVMHVTKLKERSVTGSTISPSMWKKIPVESKDPQDSIFPGMGLFQCVGSSH